MASSSRPFQSRILTRAVKLSHRLMATGTRWLRQGQATALLWMQIALYPPYVALQATRVAVRKTRAVAANWRDRWKLKPYAARTLDNAATLAPDWGLQQIMSAVVAAIATPTQASDPTPSVGLTFWNGDIRALALRPEQMPAEGEIQGLASCLQTRALVLVNIHNQVLDRLSPEQQRAITAAIVNLMAIYYRWQRQQQRWSRLQAGPLPLPRVSPRAWWPVRVMVWLLAWMQTGTVAGTLNWFKEAEAYYRLPVSAGPGWERPLADPSPRSLPPQLPLRPAVLSMQQLIAGWLVPHGRQALQRLQPLLSATSQRVRPALTAAISHLALPPSPPVPGWISSWSTGSGQPRQLLELPSLRAMFSAQLRGVQPWLLAPAAFPLSLTAAAASPLALGQQTINPLPLMGAPAVIPRQPVWAEGAANDWAGDWINVDVLAVEYIDRPLMWILRRLDAILVWLENLWQRFWQWWRSQL